MSQTPMEERLRLWKLQKQTGNKRVGLRDTTNTELNVIEPGVGGIPKWTLPKKQISITKKDTQTTSTTSRKTKSPVGVSKKQTYAGNKETAQKNTKLTQFAFTSKASQVKHEDEQAREQSSSSQHNSQQISDDSGDATQISSNTQQSQISSDSLLGSLDEPEQCRNSSTHKSEISPFFPTIHSAGLNLDVNDNLEAMNRAMTKDPTIRELESEMRKKLDTINSQAALITSLREQLTKSQESLKLMLKKNVEATETIDNNLDTLVLDREDMEILQKEKDEYKSEAIESRSVIEQLADLLQSSNLALEENSNALQESLKENESLHILNTNYVQECDQLREALQEVMAENENLHTCQAASPPKKVIQTAEFSSQTDVDAPWIRLLEESEEKFTMLRASNSVMYSQMLSHAEQHQRELDKAKKERTDALSDVSHYKQLLDQTIADFQAQMAGSLAKAVERSKYWEHTAKEHKVRADILEAKFDHVKLHNSPKP